MAAHLGSPQLTSPFALMVAWFGLVFAYCALVVFGKSMAGPARTPVTSSWKSV